MIALRALLNGERDATAPLCIDGDKSLSYGFFRQRVMSLASALSERAGQRCGVCIADPFDFACALFALMAAGKEAVIPANLAPGYLADFNQSCDLTLTDADVRMLDVAHDRSWKDIEIDPQSRLTLYTSGSSGTPKAVHKTLAQFDAEVATLDAQWPALPRDCCVLGSVPHHHMYGLLFRILWPLAAGRPFDRGLVLDPGHLQQRLSACGAAFVVSTPSQLSRWPALDGFASLTPKTTVFFSSGGPLPKETADEYATVFHTAPIDIFGSTETGAIAWRRQDVSNAWQPLHGIDTRRADDGTLHVRCGQLGHADWHRTDDSVTFDTDGRFRLTGRIDRVVKLAGKRLSLPEMEARLGAHPYVSRAAVAELDGTLRQRIGALLVLTDAGNQALLDDGRVALAKTLRRYLAAYFDLVVLPRHWRVRLAMPFDERGKLPASAVRAAFDARSDGVEVITETRDDQSLRFELRVPVALAHFAGHFPGLPIVPGVVLLDWAIRLASGYVADVRDVASIDRLKFMAPIGPGALLTLSLTHEPARYRVQFAYRLTQQAGGRDCASGVIVYRERA